MLRAKLCRDALLMTLLPRNRYEPHTPVGSGAEDAREAQYWLHQWAVHSLVFSRRLWWLNHRLLYLEMITHSILGLLSLSVIPRAIAQHITRSDKGIRPSCTVHSANNNATDDVPAILEAFEHCGHGGDIVFLPNETYHINSRLNPVVNDVNIEWRGEWLVGLLSMSTSRLKNAEFSR